MIRIENRFQLKQVRAECQAETKQEKCRVLICGGTGCLAGGSAKLYEHMKELAAEHENVQVEIGPEIAHSASSQERLPRLLRNGPPDADRALRLSLLKGAGERLRRDL